MSTANSVDHHLASLLPTWTKGPLPKPLVSLATSLLVQSRTTAGVLKGEEEVARSYACAHLAAERLKSRLSLPPIQPRPPCGPKIYKKLYLYLDRVLPNNQSKPAETMPIKGSKSKPTASLPSRTDGSKTVAVTAANKMVKSSATTKRSYGSEPVPEWIFTTTRSLCKQLKCPAAVPHAFAGVSSVLRGNGVPSPPKRLRQSVDAQRGATGKDLDVIVQIVAVLVCVLTRLESNQQLTDGVDESDRLDIITQNLVTAEHISADKTPVFQDRLSEYLKQHQQTWETTEWYSNISVNSNALTQSPEDQDEPNEDMQENHAENAPPFPSKGGLGTMMQDRIDWLSDARQAHYEQWKAGIMTKIEEIERQQASDHLMVG